MDRHGEFGCFYFRNVENAAEAVIASSSSQTLLVDTSLVLSSFHLRSAVQHALYHEKIGGDTLLLTSISTTEAEQGR